MLLTFYWDVWEIFKLLQKRFASKLMIILENGNFFFRNRTSLLQVSPYPVILSLENHCNKKQQEVMAQYLVSILGDLMLTSLLDHATSGDLPSPNVRFKRHESLEYLYMSRKVWLCGGNMVVKSISKENKQFLSSTKASLVSPWGFLFFLPSLEHWDSLKTLKKTKNLMWCC